MELIINEKRYPVIIKHKKMKRISIRLDDFGNILLSCPFRTTDKQITEVLEERKLWIANHLNNIIKNYENLRVADCQQYKAIWYLGKIYELSAECELSRPIIKDDKIYYRKQYDTKTYNKLISFLANDVQDIFYNVAREFGLNNLNLKMKKMRSRWGSCASRLNLIVLNKCLCMVPFDCIVFTILHELTHLKVQNHSSKFYEELSNVCPNHKKLKKELARYNFILHI